MATEVILVSAGATPTECSVSEWYVSDGQQVNAGDTLYSLETDKVNMDVEAEVSGIVRHVVKEGVMKMSGDLVGYILAPGEETPPELAPVNNGVATNQVELKESAVAECHPQGDPAEASQPGAGKNDVHERVRSTPAARKLARENDVDYRALDGSGPAGRVIKADVQRAITSHTPSPVAAAPKSTKTEAPAPRPQVVSEGWGYVDKPVPAENVDEPTGIRLNSMRKTIARRMMSSLQNNAQLSMDMEFIADETVKLRTALIEEWQDENIRPSYTDLIIKAVAKGLRKHALMNGTFCEEEIRFNQEINIGVAVALESGLVVPVVRNADKLSIREISLEVARLAEAARRGTLSVDDLSGGTFTVSTLGVYGVQSFTPIINEPQVGILGVNKMYDGVEWKGETPVKAKKMNLSLTWDHRVLDGVPAAQFLAEICQLLQSPHRLLI